MSREILPAFFVYLNSANYWIVKKIRLTLFIILITKLVLAQTYEDDTSVVYKQFLYKNGTVASEGYLNNNKPTGFWRSYYQTGVLKSEGKWTNNKLDSV